MKRFSNRDKSKIAVVFLVLIQITATVCYFKRDGQTITISHEEEDFLSENIFDDIANITEIRIAGNEFSKFSENIFKSQPNLLILDLNSNSLSTLPENIFKAQGYLKKLILSRNILNTLPENIFKSQPDLLILDLSSNSLSTLSENIFKSQSELQELDLRYNNLSILSENIFDSLSKLLILDLRWNNLTTLPEKIFKSQTNLKILELSWINLKALPANIFDNQFNLETLDLHGNELTALPEHIFKNIVNLQILDVRSNKLTTLGHHIFKNLHDLMSLDLSSNRLTTLSEKIFESQADLWTLNLRENQLSTLSKTTIRDIFKNLRYLIRFEKSLSENPWLCDCTFLESIRPYMDGVLSSNEMECVDGVQLADKFNVPLTPIVINKSIQSTKNNQKYAEINVCSVLPTNETKTCPSDCNCMFPSDGTSIIVDCSNSSLKNVPADLTTELKKMSAFNEIELNFDNNNITILPNLTTIHGFQSVVNISAANNSIETISVDNLPENSVVIDLSGNKLEYLTSSVIEHLSNMKTLKSLILAGNPWICDQAFNDFVRLNKEKVDYENIVCYDRDSLFQKHKHQLNYWIKNNSRDGDEVKSMLTDSSESVCEISHDDVLGQICPTECSCFIAQQNTTISYECPVVSFTEILNHFELGKNQWPLLKHRRMIFNF